MKKQLETWKKSMENSASLYYVSNLGRCKRVMKSTGEAILSRGRLNENIGYLVFGNKYVHRLVAEQFLGPKPAWAEQVDHINADKTDNRLENLRWVTRKQNNSTPEARRRKSVGAAVAAAFSKCGQIVKASKDGQELFFKNGREAARALGCSHVLVYNCLNRRGSARRAKGWTLAWVPCSSFEHLSLKLQAINDMIESHLEEIRKIKKESAETR